MKLQTLRTDGRIGHLEIIAQYYRDLTQPPPFYENGILRTERRAFVRLRAERQQSGQIEKVTYYTGYFGVSCVAAWAHVLIHSVWLRKQLKGTAWLSAVSSQSGRGTRGARVLQVGASWAGRGAKIEV